MNRKIISAAVLWGVFAFLLTDYGKELVKNLTSKAVDLIKTFEGFASTAYYDAAGKLTIGYGHLIKAGEDFNFIDKAQAEKLLINDMAVAENAVNSYAKVPISANQKDALVSFVFNLGSGNFANSTLLKKLNAGDYAGAANEFDRWVYAGGKVIPGLVERRAKEKALFLKG